MDLSCGMLACWHMTAGSKAAIENMSDKGKVYITLKGICYYAQMEAVDDPIVYSFPVYPELVDSPHDEGGVSGSMIITTSSIHCHTWPEQGKARFVLDSCKEFDVDAISTYLISTWYSDVISTVYKYPAWPKAEKNERITNRLNSHPGF